MEAAPGHRSRLEDLAPDLLATAEAVSGGWHEAVILLSPREVVVALPVDDENVLLALLPPEAIEERTLSVLMHLAERLDDCLMAWESRLLSGAGGFA